MILGTPARGAARLLVLVGLVWFSTSSFAATIVVYGARGGVGEVIGAEALSRGHQVIGVSRNPAEVQLDHPNFSAVAGDVTDLDSMLEVIVGADVVVIAVGGIGQGNSPEEAVTYRAAETFVRAATELGDSAPRVIQVSGGTTLRVNGVWGLDDPTLLEGTSRHGRYWGHWLAIEQYRASTGVEWTVMTPPPGAMVPGERTGVYRLGGEDVLLNAQGESTISVADFAVAIVDEAENPQATGQRVSVAPAY